MGDAEKVKLNKILIIEDEFCIREMCRLALGDEDFQVDIVENGEMAIKMKVTEYDLFLLDIRMPTMNGIDFYEQLKAEYPWLLNKVVFTTGDLMNNDVVTFLKTTGRPILPKPFGIHELKTMIRTTLGTKIESPL
jgi:DNA-binding response OmpR family regulator